MADVDGNWNCVIKSPLGDQQNTLTVNSSGETFTGTMSGSTGTIDIEEGRVAGNQLSWKAPIKVPMPMTLDCQATIDGDTITGTAGAGAFGSFPLSGVRA